MNKKTFLIFIALALVIVILIIVALPRETNEQILMVVEFSRHGQRSPTYIYNFTENPSDNFNDSDELTPKGYSEHFKLGNFLYNKYIKNISFLSPVYNNKEIYV
jgi:hypothetical protein